MTWILILESRCVYIIGNIFLNRGFGDFLKVPRHNETSVTLPFKNFSSQTVPFLNAVEDHNPATLRIHVGKSLLGEVEKALLGTGNVGFFQDETLGTP